MSIHFISGKPGGGKSLYGVRLIVDELVNGSRPIVTNVPLKLDALNFYLQDKYPASFQRRFVGASVLSHISEQVILLSEDELAKFFTFRGSGVRLDSVANDAWKVGVRPDFSKVKDSGVFYVLDEVHIAFNSRAWASTGHEVLYYLSQHRKLGDDVVCITQSIGNVDKQFRSVSQDFTYIKNLSKQKAGFFRLPSVFMRNTYTQPATDTSKPSETGSFTLDAAGLASLYDTARGVGIHGRTGADTSERKKGLHWLWFALGFPFLIFLFLHFTPILLSRFFSHGKTVPASSPDHSGKAQGSAKFIEKGHSSEEISSSGSVRQIQFLQRPLGDSPEDTNNVTCSGIAILSKDDVTAFFSDGSTAYGSEGEIQKISGHWVYAFGKKYRLCGSPACSTSSRISDDYRQGDHIVDYGQNDLPDAPVNDAEILPSINSAASGIPPAPRINGLSSMSSSQTVNRAESLGY